MATVALALAACGSSSGSVGTTTTATMDPSGSITVSAAASLTQVFTKLRNTFRARHPGTMVAFNFGSSAALAAQIEQGSPADVFASASAQAMEPVQRAGDLAGKPVIFARNSLEMVVKPGNPLGIRSLADLTKANVVAICVRSAPCGAAAVQALRTAHVTVPTSKVSLGQDVDATLAQVTTGDADAAIVYVTNAKGVGDHGVGVPIPTALNVATSYPIAVIKSTGNKALAAAWIAYVLGPNSQSVLRQAGFLPAH